VAKTISAVETSNDNFDDVFTIVNEMANAFLVTTTVASNTTGDITTGNGFVNGIFGATTVVATNIRGGTVATAAHITLLSNVVANGAQINVSSNVYINSANVTVGNSTVTGLKVSNDGTSILTTVGGNTATVTANIVFNGVSLKLPVGNTGQRPSGVANGLMRFNEETNTLEVYANSAWESIVSFGGTFAAASIPFTPAGNLSNTDVQTTLEELDDEKVSKTGDTITGNVIINKNGGSIPTSPAGTILKVSQVDGVATYIDITSFGNTSGIIGRRSDGINSSKTTLQAGDVITKFAGRGYDGNTYSNVDDVSIEFRATQNWSNTGHGSSIVLKSTANTSNAASDVLIISANGITANALFLAKSNTTVNANFTVDANATIANNLTVTSGVISGNGSSITSITGSQVTAANTTAVGTSRFSTNTEIITGSDGALAVGVVSFAASRMATGDLRTANSNKTVTTSAVWNDITEVTLTDAATVTANLSSFINGKLTLEGNRTLGEPTSLKVGQAGFIRIIQDGVGSRTLAYHSDWKFVNGITPLLSTASSTNDILFYQVIAANTVFAALSKAIG